MNFLIGPDAAPVTPGTILHTFQLADDHSLRLWTHALARTSQCLLITGRTLGLDHPSLERIDRLLKKGDALAAVVTASVEHDAPSA
jgi:hypothetical protein